MLYFIAKKYNMCIKMNEESDKYKLGTFFPSSYEIIDVNNIEDYFDNIFKIISFKNMDARVFILEIVDSKSDIIISYFGTQSDCEILKSILGTGVIIKTNMTGKSAKLNYDKTLAGVSTLKKRIISFPDFIKEYITETEVLSVKQEVLLPDKYIDKDISICKIDKNSTYLDDKAYQKLFKSVIDLEKSYNALIAQKDGLQTVVKGCDNEILNIVHDLEFGFNKVSACDGYMFSKRVNEIRECRRRAKDKLEVIYAIMEVFETSDFKIISELPERLKNRKYRKRNSYGMFDDLDE